MGSWKTHLFFSSLICIVSIIYTTKEQMDFNYLWFFLVLLFGILPDIDHDNSLIRKIVNVILLTLFVFSLLFYKYTAQIHFIYLGIFFIVIALILKTTNHRGVIHSIFAGLIFIIPIFYFNKLASLLCFTSYFLHLVVDSEIKLLK